MNEINCLFFELIRVAIGTQETLSRFPSEAEWEELFEMAVKQSLVGVCFVGLHTLGADSDEGYAQIGMSEDLFFDWMGMAAQINMKNDLVNQQCVDLQKRLAADGLDTCVLKGQGIAGLYGEELRGFRQSGDIDLWVDAPMKMILEYAKKYNSKFHFDYLHVNLDAFDDTEVELHYRPGCMYNLRRNRSLQSWFANNKEFVGIPMGNGNVTVPTINFNAFYILHHTYRHLINGGIGMRQMMDYYFVLQASLKIQEVASTIESFGMKKFASGVMWIMQEVFGLTDDRVICKPDEEEGQFLLNEIMMGGNFGHHDSRKEKRKPDESKWDILVRKIKTNMHLLTHYPSEVLSVPFYFVWHYLWKKKQNYSLQ